MHSTLTCAMDFASLFPVVSPLFFAMQPGFQANQTLREAAAAVVRPDGSKGFFVGSADAYAHLTQDATFRQLALTEFNLVTAENECKFGPTEPEQGQYTLDQCTYVTGTMLNASGVVRGHNTVWGQQNPNWLENGNFNGQQLQVRACACVCGLAAAHNCCRVACSLIHGVQRPGCLSLALQLRTPHHTPCHSPRHTCTPHTHAHVCCSQGFMEDHIGKVMGNYAGTFYCWDVVNEPVCDSGQPVNTRVMIYSAPRRWLMGPLGETGLDVSGRGHRSGA